MKFVSGLVAMAALAGLAGCSTAQQDPALRNDPAFAAGYADGCRTGNARQQAFDQTITRNDAQWSASAAYRAGWRTGYGACGTRSDIEQRQEILGSDRYDQGQI